MTHEVLEMDSNNPVLFFSDLDFIGPIAIYGREGLALRTDTFFSPIDVREGEGFVRVVRVITVVRRVCWRHRDPGGLFFSLLLLGQHERASLGGQPLDHVAHASLHTDFAD